MVKVAESPQMAVPDPLLETGKQQESSLVHGCWLLIGKVEDVNAEVTAFKPVEMIT